METDGREWLGRVVRETWVEFCRATGDDKPSHLAPWEELGEWDKEVDMRIADAVLAAVGSPDAGQGAALTENEQDNLRAMFTDYLTDHDLTHAERVEECIDGVDRVLALRRRLADPAAP